jgi:hypothetical protein
MPLVCAGELVAVLRVQPRRVHVSIGDVQHVSGDLRALLNAMGNQPGMRPGLSGLGGPEAGRGWHSRR